MRKYMVIYKANLMSNLQYIANIFVSSITYLLHIFIFIQIWNYIYEDPSELINGYSKTQMMWYIVMTETIWCSVAGRRIVREVCNDVKSGNIAYNINKPYSYIGYILFYNLSESTLRGIVFSVIGLSVGQFLIGSIPCLSIIEILAMIFTSILAIIINLLFLTFIGLCAFIMEDSNPLYWIYSKIQLIFGIVFPIEFFPKVLQPIIKYSPVFVLCYGPAKLFINFNFNTFITIVLAQILYIFISLGLCSLIYKKGVKKLNVNGG